MKGKKIYEESGEVIHLFKDGSLNNAYIYFLPENSESVEKAAMLIEIVQLNSYLGQSNVERLSQVGKIRIRYQMSLFKQYRYMVDFSELPAQ